MSSGNDAATGASHAFGESIDGGSADALAAGFDGTLAAHPSIAGVAGPGFAVAADETAAPSPR